MGNNNATANLTEEESSKLETNGKSPLDYVPVEATQDQVFLAGQGQNEDKQSENFSDGKESKETEPQKKGLGEDPKVTKVGDDMNHNGLVLETDEKLEKNTSVPEGKETIKTETQSNGLVEDPKVTKVKEDICHNVLEGLVMETDEQLQKHTSVAEGVETVCESTKLEELTQEPGNEEKPRVSDEIVFVSPGFNETAGNKENLVMNQSLEETAPEGKVANHDQEICVEQRRVLPEIKPQEILNLDNHVFDDYDEVTNEGKAEKEISKPGSQGSNAILEIGFYKEERDLKLGREASLKRMSRCRSLPVSNSSRVMGDSLVQELVSEVTFPSRNKTGLDKANTPDILPVSCLTINEVQETTEAINESSKEANLEMRSPSFSNDLRIEERSDEPTRETPLLCQDKTETFKATLDVEDKTVMLKRSETEKIRGFELSLGLSMNLSGRCNADDSFKETHGSVDNLVAKKANTSETILVSCVGSNKAQETTDVIIERNKEDLLEMQTPSSGNDLIIEERSGEPTEETPLLSQDKTETYKATLDVEEKTVMLKRSETEKIRGFELSLGLSMNLSGRCDADNSFKLETKGSGDNLVDKKANTSETLFVSCVRSSKAQESTEVITESNKEDLLEMRSPISGNDLRAKERRGESTEHIPLLCQDKIKTYNATTDEEKKTVMLKRSESEKTRGHELSLGLSMKPGERSEADDSLKENNNSRDNLLDKKASGGSMKGRVRKRSKSSLFGTCLCCNTAMN